MAKRVTIVLSDEALRRLDAYCEMAGTTKGGCIGMLICQNLPPARMSNIARTDESETQVEVRGEDGETASTEPAPQDIPAPAEAEDDWPFDFNFDEEVI